MCSSDLSGNVLAENPSDLYQSKAFDNSFLGINSSEFLEYALRNQISQIPSRNDPAEIVWLEKVLNANMEDFIQKITNNPNTINEDLYNVKYIIYPNY